MTCLGVLDTGERDKDDEPMGIEIDLAARFQQMAGIYDSKPKDFAREMRENRDSIDTSSSSIRNSKGTSNSINNDKRTVSFSKDSKQDSSRTTMEFKNSDDDESNSDIYKTKAPKQPYRAGVQEPLAEKTLEQISDEFKWKKFLPREEEQDTDR
jgi:hypothetical protein